MSPVGVPASRNWPGLTLAKRRAAALMIARVVNVGLGRNGWIAVMMPSKMRLAKLCGAGTAMPLVNIQGQCMRFGATITHSLSLFRACQRPPFTLLHLQQCPSIAT